MQNLLEIIDNSWVLLYLQGRISVILSLYFFKQKTIVDISYDVQSQLGISAGHMAVYRRSAQVPSFNAAVGN